ncbi:hypothetical protein DQ04_23071000, partial [Trypanosoma grayi]|uniref:hypothetical protein n=1 Tax=Trypanosoma grayi TaxID=71804 RepID=UPI0004F49CCD
CCTSLCVAAAGGVQSSLTTDNAELTLTETVKASSCAAPTTSSKGKPKKVTITTKATLKKKSNQEEMKEVTKTPNTELDVSEGYNLSLGHTLVVETKKKGESAQLTPGSPVTYVVSVTTTTAGYAPTEITTKEDREVSVPVGHDVNIAYELAATCIPTPGTNLPLPPKKDKATKQITDIPEDEAKALSEKASNPEPNPTTTTTTTGGKPNDETNSGESSSAVSKDLPAPSSSAKDGTETDNSVPVSDADHTVSTATPQSGTTTEGAPNADAGTSTSAGEGAKLPDRNTDASSSSTAWVRAPLL